MWGMGEGRNQEMMMMTINNINPALRCHPLLSITNMRRRCWRLLDNSRRQQQCRRLSGRWFQRRNSFACYQLATSSPRPLSSRSELIPQQQQDHHDHPDHHPPRHRILVCLADRHILRLPPPGLSPRRSTPTTTPVASPDRGPRPVGLRALRHC